VVNSINRAMCSKAIIKAQFLRKREDKKKDEKRILFKEELKLKT